MIPFGEFVPDQPHLGNAGATVAKNVIPALKGYRSYRQLAAVSGAATNDILGMYAGKADDGDTSLYVGDSAKLYRMDASDSSLTDKSKGGGYSTASGDVWKFAQFGETLLATNFTDNIQTATIDSASAFADLSGSPPKAKFITTVKDQVFCGFTNDTDGVTPYRVRWSAINSATGWTVGTSLSDYQDVVDVGDCTGLVGGEHLIALFERGIVRASFVGAPLIYQFDRLTNQKGCTVPGSVASVGAGLVFFLSDDGFHMLKGNEIVSIGAEKINKWFLERFKIANKENMVASVDPMNQNVIWAYPNTDSEDGSNNEILIYNYNLNRWSYVEQSTTALAPLFTAGYTLENLDNVNSSIDSIPASLDDPMWKGGSFFFAGAKDKKVQSFTGDRLEATLETGEFDVSPGKRSLVNNIIPYVTSASGTAPTISAAIGSRLRQNDDVSFGTTSSQNADGYCPVRSSGTYHRVRLSLSGDWEQAQGVDVDIQQMGMR